MKSLRDNDPIIVIERQSREFLGRAIAFTSGVIVFASIGLILAWRG